MVGLWGGPYLTHIYGFSLTERGNMLFVAVVAQVVGSFLWGTSDRLFESYKLPVMTAQLLTAVAMGLAAWIGVFPPSGAPLLVYGHRVFYRRAVGPDRARQVAVSARWSDAESR